jgi:hypothetical protein
MPVRDALFYPNIHITNERWLKATLLCFPHILRMMPERYEPNDSRFVRKLAKSTGVRNEALVGRYDLNTGAVSRMAMELQRKLKADLEATPGFAQQFSRDATAREYGNEDVYYLHRDKLGYILGELLEQWQLAWEPEAGGGWLAVHPLLGETFMSCAAAAAAQEAGLEIVTSDAPIHQAVATHDTSDGDRTATIPGDVVQTRLAQLVIVNHFDIDSISADDLIAMSREGEALFDFRQAVADWAARIPPMSDEARLQRHLEQSAEELIEKWQQKRKSMSAFAKRFFGVGLLKDSADAAKDAIKDAGSYAGAGAVVGATAHVASGAAAAAGLGGVVSSALLGAVPGLAIGLVVRGVTVWSGMRRQERTDSLRYLTLLQKGAATTLVASPA